MTGRRAVGRKASRDGATQEELHGSERATATDQDHGEYGDDGQGHAERTSLRPLRTFGGRGRSAQPAAGGGHTGVALIDGTACPARRRAPHPHGPREAGYR